MARLTSFILILGVFSLFPLSGTAQTNVLHGTISTSDSIPLKSAIVSIITQRDSLFVSFTRTNDRGRFSIHAPPGKGKYFLIASYPKFADVSILFDVDSVFKNGDLGNIRLPLNATLMEEVTVVAKKRLMNAKGDTLEYDISQLKIEPNDRVEDILNQLPGIQVIRGGQILSFGRPIQRVLVDGEPFFGNDPTLVTKNIRADMVEKIQVYDDASRREKVTGISDNDKRHTINIKLKENKKTGMFGSAELGYLNKIYNNILMLNRFVGKEKMFAYGLISNTGKIGLGYKSLGGSGGSIGDEFNSSTGNYMGEGKPKVYGAGLHYSNIWNDLHKLSASVSVNGLNTVGSKKTYSQINSDFSFLSTSDSIEFERKTNNQGLQLKYEREGKSNFYIDFIAAAKQNENTSVRVTKLFNVANDRPSSEVTQNRKKTGNRNTIGFTSDWSKSLGKKGRSISIGLYPNLTHSTEKVTISSYTKKSQDNYTDNFLISSNTNEDKLFSTIDYTEPILGGILTLGYSNRYYKGVAETNTLSSSKYDSAHSGRFSYQYNTNRFETSFQLTKDKITALVGTYLTLDKSLLKDFTDDKEFSDRFLFIQPRVNLSYNVRKNYSIKMNYSKTRAPLDMGYVVPFSSVENLPNFYVGNRKLQPGQEDKIDFSYYNFRLTKLRIYKANIGIRINKNAIGYSTFTRDEQIFTSPINIPRSTYGYDFTTSVSQANTKKDYFMILIQGNKSVGYNFVDNIENQLSSFFVKLQPTYSFSKKKGVQFNVVLSPTYEQMKFSRNVNYNYKGFGMEGSSDFLLFLPHKISFKQTLNLTYKPKFKLLNTSLNQFLWDVSVRKQLGKESQFAIEFSVNDLLNQNTGFQRYYSSTGFAENRYTTIQRYFLLSFKWDYNKMGEK